MRSVPRGSLKLNLCFFGKDFFCLVVPQREINARLWFPRLSILSALGLTTLILSLATGLSAQISNQVFVGARPLGMGETFVAVANDGNAIYWNPAGLPLIDHYSLYGMHANLYNSGVKSNYVSFFLPFTERLTLGADWFNIGFGDDELEYFDNKFNLAVGYRISGKLSLGLNLKHLRFEGKYLGAAPGDVILNARANGFGADVGLLYEPWRRLRLGIMAHDVSDTRVKHDNDRGTTEVIQRRDVRFGAAYFLRQNLLVAADWDDRLHFGSEFWPASFFALRAGLQKDRHTEEGPTYAFGAGFEQKLLGQTLRLDFAYTVPPTLPDMKTFSASILFDLFAPVVKIEKVEIEPIYASLYKHYAEGPIGKAVVTYKGREPLNCEISVAIPGYARSYSQDLSLKPAAPTRNTRDSANREPAAAGAVDSVALKTDFTQNVLAVDDKARLSAEVTITYLHNRRPGKAKRSARFDLFPLNKLDWSRGSAQAAAFIDHENKEVVAAAEDFLTYVPAEFLVNSSITRAQKLFEGLGYAGITYGVDRYSPYAIVYKSIDNVLYPYQLLEIKKGDCDDLTVLYAALLESCNIPTALVCVPGHIFLMFDTGIHERKQEMMRLPQALYQIYDERVWIPIEVTAVGRSFGQAWESGARTFQEYAAAGDTEIVKVRQAWRQYEAVKNPTGVRRSLPPVLDSLRAGHLQDRHIRQQQEAYLNGLEQQLAQEPDRIEIRNRLARSYALSKDFAKAETHLRAVIAQDAKNFVAHNNLGNVYFWQGKLDSAHVHYQKALELARAKDDSMGAALNLATLYYAAGDDTTAQAFYASVISDSADWKRAGSLLGIDFAEAGAALGAEKKQVRAVSEASVEEQLGMALAASTKGTKPKPKPKPAPKPTGPRNTRISNTEVENVFYWAR
jgi:Flp pilus assembly protein TadD